MNINSDNINELITVNNNLVVSSYHSGVGKTYAGNNYSNVIDLESSDYQWIYAKETPCGERRKGFTNGRVANPAFPLNYANKILELLATEKNSVIAISSHESVLDLLLAVETRILTTYPANSLKEIMYERCINRGNSEEFANKMLTTFEKRNEFCLKQKYTIELTDKINTISKLLISLNINLDKKIN